MTTILDCMYTPNEDLNCYITLEFQYCHCCNLMYERMMRVL